MTVCCPAYRGFMPLRRLCTAALAAALGLVIAACGSPSSPSPASTRATGVAGGSTSGGSVAPSGPCGTAADATYRHVVWIWMENRTYDAVINGTGDAPALQQYADACGLATDYHGVTHPSLPNYIAATAGSTLGITDDCGPDDCP